GRRVSKQTVEQMVDQILNLSQGTKIQVLAPIIRFKKGEHKQILEDIQKKGFVRVRVDGNTFEVEEDIKIDRYKNHNIEVVVDRLLVKPEIKTRLADSIETALSLSEGIVVIEHDEATMRIADYIVDLGPGAGIHGGFLVARGSIEDIVKNKKSITGRYLNHHSKIDIPHQRRKGNGKYLEIFGARQFNLKSLIYFLFLLISA
ncbi:unnamed protein product, partial [marine sediment metagenome]